VESIIADKKTFKYAYFPGCSLKSTSKEYDISAREVASSLGVILKEIPDWTCCGATPAHLTMHILSIGLPVKILLQVKEMGISEVVTCCAACFSRLKFANDIMSKDQLHREMVSRVLSKKYEGEVSVRHFLDVLVNEYGIESISKKIVKPLKGLKVACYYGCLLVRPPEVTKFDDSEDPHIMDDLINVTGAEAISWPYKTECCGASHSLSNTEIVLRLSNDILRFAKESGADVVAVACPMCQSNLDLRQGEIEKRYETKINLPVLYFTQLLGLALGAESKNLGLNMHLVNPFKILQEKGLL